MKRIYTIFVTLFWFVMMGLLFQKEILPSLVITNSIGYKIPLSKDSPIRESWMGIYFKDKKIGFSNTLISQAVKEGIAGYKISEVALLRFSMLGEHKSIRVNVETFLNEDYRLKSFSYKLKSGDRLFSASGYVTGGTLNVVIDTGLKKTKKTLKIKNNTLISNSISPILLFKKLDKNKEIKFEVFDPVSFSRRIVTIKNIGDDIVEYDGVEYNTHIFQTDMEGIITKTWMSEDGDILKEESPLGFTMKKQSAEKALDFSGSGLFGYQDLVFEFSLVSNIEIVNPRDVSFIKIEENGVVKEIFKSKEPLPEKVLSLPIEDLEEEDFIQSKNEKIVKLAKDIIGGEDNSWVSARKILHWVYNNIKKTPTLSVPSSLEVLDTMQGDCNEHTVLFTALARSVGIPTKMIAGLVYMEGFFYYHAWPRVYVGEWIDMDPTIGQEIADATHIPLLEGGLKEQIGLIRVIGDLEIKVIEYR